MRPRALRLALVVFVVVALAPAGAGAATRSVTVGNDFFSPRTVTVSVGDTVLWTWRSRGRRHNVANASFGDSGYRRRGSFSSRFARTGRYQYFCFLHEGMNGTVVVRR